jgi:hypothetical protein
VNQPNASIVVRSNAGGFGPAVGLISSRPVDAPFLSPTAGIDKLAVVTAALAPAEVVAFAGDGRPDLKLIVRVDPRFRFVRGWLPDKLAFLS